MNGFCRARLRGTAETLRAAASKWRPARRPSDVGFFVTVAVLAFVVGGCAMLGTPGEEEIDMTEQIGTAKAAFADAAAAYERGDFTAFREACAKVLDLRVPAYQKSYARLRIAQSYVAEGNVAAAREEYEAILNDGKAPEVHRSEADERIEEIDRVARGESPRDPAASRTTIPEVNPSVEFFVSPDGDDAGPGSADRPFATLERARDAVREAKAGGLPPGGIAVTLKPGEYRRTTIFSLFSEDAGAEGAPIVYRAEVPGTAVLYGGGRLSGFSVVDDPDILARLPEEARGEVYQCDLKERGITNYGRLAVRGMGQRPSPPTLELYFDRKPMTLARWPNEGFVGIGRLIEPGQRGVKPSVFEYLSDRHERWVDAEDAWLFGYFKWLWADSTIKIGSIDPEKKTLTTAEAYDYRGGMATTQGIIYYAFNLLEEIDMPGEWYLDRNTGILYFWPPSDPDKATIEIGMLSTRMLALSQTSYIRIEGLTFDLGRYNGITVVDSDHCLIAGSTVERFAGNGITILGGSDNGIFGCDIGIIGRRATEVIGGDRKTLTPGNHFVENNRIHDFGRIDRTYTPAVQLEGVGNRVSHNLFYNSPSSVMRIEGNDHIIEYNETHSAVQESDDQGAMELFYNPTYRGVVFRYNYFHDNGKTGTEKAVHGQAAIRLDDAISGVLIYGNVFVRSANGNFGAVQLNSGRDNLIENNLFIDCKQGISGGWNPNNTVWKSIREGRPRRDIYYTDPLYLERYPAIATMMDEPGINSVRRNILYRSGPIITRSPSLFDLFENQEFGETDPGFVDVAAGNYALRPDAPVLVRLWFAPIPFDEIGLYEHPLRASWPVVTEPVTIPDWR